MLFLSISTYVCIPILVHSTVDSTIGSPAYLLRDDVLIENMLRGAVGIIVHILGFGVEGLLSGGQSWLVWIPVAKVGDQKSAP